MTQLGSGFSPSPQLTMLEPLLASLRDAILADVRADNASDLRALGAKVDTLLSRPAPVTNVAPAQVSVQPQINVEPQDVVVDFTSLNAVLGDIRNLMRQMVEAEKRELAPVVRTVERNSEGLITRVIDQRK